MVSIGVDWLRNLVNEKLPVKNKLAEININGAVNKVFIALNYIISDLTSSIMGVDNLLGIITLVIL